MDCEPRGARISIGLNPSIEFANYAYLMKNVQYKERSRITLEQNTNLRHSLIFMHSRSY